MSPEKQPPDSLPPDAQPPDTQSGAEMRALIADLRPRNADLLEALHRVEGRYGYVSPQALRLIGEQLRLSAAHVYGAASFYSELRTTPPPARTVAWCSGVACLLKNSGGILRALEAVLGCRLGSQREDGRVGLVRGQCNGTCELAPQLRLDGTVIGRLTAARAVTLARALLEDAPPPPGAPPPTTHPTTTTERRR